MEKHSLKAAEIKEKYSITELLASLGYEPVKRARNELVYLSMLRDSDTTPSFSVNDKQGTWFDFGEGKGGNIIDLALRYWKGLPFPEILEKIVQTCDEMVPTPESRSYYNRQPVKPKVPNYGVVEVRELGNNATILNYLESRGVLSVAEGRLKEIYYYVEDEDNNRKNYFGAGWQNEQGAWEIRNVHFKGCLGHKAISFIPNTEKRLAVFEGFFDYLSWLTENTFAPDTVLVLNSVALLQAGITKAESFPEINLYFDNDSAGRQATLDFVAALPWANDRSGCYEGYKDYNERIIAGGPNNQFSR